MMQIRMYMLFLEGRSDLEHEIYHIRVVGCILVKDHGHGIQFANYSYIYIYIYS